MASSFTPNLNLELQATGENVNTWGVQLNTNVISTLDSALGGTLSISVAGSSNVTPTSDQAENIFHTLTGLLTGNIAYILPTVGRLFVIDNTTTGAFTVTVRTALGTGIVVPQGYRAFVTGNGTDYRMAENLTLKATNNLSDLVSAPTALTNLGGTTVGKALFTAADAAAGRTALALGTAAVVNTGTSGATIPMNNTANVFSALQSWSKGADITPTAGVLTLGTDGNYFVVPSGAITSIVGLGIGASIKLQFGGASLLTNSADLVIPGGNYTTVAGDVIEFTGYASGDVRVTAAALVSGLPLKASQSATITFQQAQGVAGGTSTGSSWTAYPLNTTVYDPDNIASLSVTQIILAAGTYIISGAACLLVTNNTWQAKIRLFNVTDTSDAVMGINNGGSDAGSDICNAQMSGAFTITATKTMQMQYYVTIGQASTGLGSAINVGGSPEVYGFLQITKVK